jgi:hypothetical protein
MNPEHEKLARELAATPEQRLADVTEPEAFGLAMACVKSSYKEGRLYILALQARQHAAESGSSLAVMRWCRP